MFRMIFKAISSTFVLVWKGLACFLLIWFLENSKIGWALGMSLSLVIWAAAITLTLFSLDRRLRKNLDCPRAVKLEIKSQAACFSVALTCAIGIIAGLIFIPLLFCLKRLVFLLLLILVFGIFLFFSMQILKRKYQESITAK